MKYLVTWNTDLGMSQSNFINREEAEAWAKRTLAAGTAYRVLEILVEGVTKQPDKRLLAEYHHKIKFIVTEIGDSHKHEVAAFSRNGTFTLYGIKSRNWWNDGKFKHDDTVQTVANYLTEGGRYLVEVVDG